MKRTQVPVCSVHNRFQTSHGRWLEQSEDFEEHIKFTDAIIELESPCDLCDDPSQIEIDFDDEDEYHEQYDKMIASGMFWEFHPTLSGEWEKDKDYFIGYQKKLQILLQIIL